MSEIEETAKATQESAKTMHKALEVDEKFGHFIAKYIGGSLEQGLGIWEDKFKYIRVSNQLTFMEKTKKRMDELGIKSIQELELKTAIPLLEASSLENDEYLKNLWVNLLVNSTNSNNDFTLERAYIAVLEQLTTLEAKIMKTIYSTNLNQNEHYDIFTHNLPESISYEIPEDITKSINRTIENAWEGIQEDEKYTTKIEPQDNIKLALSNLARLKCINLSITLQGESYSTIHITLFGRKLYEAIS